jgi:hypothetical protein
MIYILLIRILSFVEEEKNIHMMQCGCHDKGVPMTRREKRQKRRMRGIGKGSLRSHKSREREEKKEKGSVTFFSLLVCMERVVCHTQHPCK